ncbi:hypothetical protein CWI37_0288p0020 [Hamiltosporidium tvaerminnensis]|uniref:Uncharacterized protein n=1 Tax=Hamiltosporidium tvaerminnensis TaxID=1176355 RepID=A0A4Q9L9M1_9MICR|nr:hypothetical protein CWI37_0288p0020 [Hamiltosporidium tvaerminnensis]
MNLYAYFKTKRMFYEKFYVTNLILWIFFQINFVTAHKFVYWFEKNKNSEILFYHEIETNTAVNNEFECDYYLKVSIKSNKPQKNELNRVYTYKKENFIKYEVFDKILVANTMEDNNGKIECNFDIIYDLKLTEDISSLPEKIDFNLVITLFLTFKYLKVVRQENVLKFLEILILRMYAQQYGIDSNNKYLVLENLFKPDIFKNLEFFNKKNLISALLNNFMIYHVFYEDNLILLNNSKDDYETDFFNEHIPYKNLLINDYRVFYKLERVFKNVSISNYFHILLNEIDIKSLIINNFEESEKHKADFRIFKRSTVSFKSIIISNLLYSSERILYELNKAIDLKLEYFGLCNLSVENNYFLIFLKSQKLKGIILNNVVLKIDIHFFDVYMNKNKTLKYIELKNVETMFTWIEFIDRLNIEKIILSFNSESVEENFIRGFDSLENTLGVQYLEIRFFNYRINKELCKILRNFPALQTLKLSNYQPDKKMNRKFHKVIENMKQLSTLIIEHEYFSNKFLNSVFQNKRIQFLHINNYNYKKKILKLEVLSNPNHLTHLGLRSINISAYSLVQIFRLKNLEFLSLKFCDLEAIKNFKTHHVMATNIRCLNLKGSILNSFRDFDILEKLNYLEKLTLSGLQLHLCSLNKLNSNCNLTLKKLSYIWGILSADDLNRIKYLEVLIQLNISRCEFLNTSLCELGRNCNFLSSLKYLDLSYVELTLNDFLYLQSFKHLRNLKISFFEGHGHNFDFSMNSYFNNYFFSRKIYTERTKFKLIEYFGEINSSENYIFL